jgi:hypothetical protein
MTRALEQIGETAAGTILAGVALLVLIGAVVDRYKARVMGKRTTDLVRGKRR